jgi:hypothetical protein
MMSSSIIRVTRRNVCSFEPQEKWINPFLGDIPLDAVNNSATELFDYAVVRDGLPDR